MCDPTKPHNRHCSRYADGLTSIVDLAGDHKGNIYAVELSKRSWLAMELKVKGSEIGGLFKIPRHRRDDRHGVRELVPNQLRQPAGVDVDRHDDIYLVGPVFGPGALMKLDD